MTSMQTDSSKRHDHTQKVNNLFFDLKNCSAIVLQYFSFLANIYNCNLCADKYLH